MIRGDVLDAESLKNESEGAREVSAEHKLGCRTTRAWFGFEVGKRPMPSEVRHSSTLTENHRNIFDNFATNFAKSLLLLVTPTGI